MPQPLLPLCREGYPDVLAQGVSRQTDRQGLLPSWAGPTQFMVCPCVQMAARWVGLEVDGLLSGIGVWLLVSVTEVVVCTDGKCKIYLLSRCFRGVCLSLRYDMVCPGQSADWRGDICCWTCCSSETIHPEVLKLRLESWLVGVSFPGLRVKSYPLLQI